MSHSVVKEIPTQRDNTFVIVVGQDGRISVDQETLDGLISSGEGANAQVSVLRVGEDDGSTVEMTLDTFESDAMGVSKCPASFPALAPGNKITDELLIMTDEAMRNLNSFRMDHCYTPLTSPSQQRPPVPPDHPDHDLELDDLAHTLSILEGSDKPDDLELKPPIKRPIMKEPKKVSMLNKVNKMGVQKVYKGVKTVLAKTQKVLKKPVVQEDGSEPDGELNDLDVDQTSPRVKTLKRTYKRRPKPDSNEVSSELKQKIVKVRKGVKSIVYKPIVEKAVHEPKMEAPAVTPMSPPVAAPLPPEPLKSPECKKLPKKEKKVPKPVDDGIALFSTPDIIRRVGKEGERADRPATTPTTPESPVPRPARLEDKQKSKVHGRNSLDSKLPSPDKVRRERMSLEGKERRPSNEKNDRLQSALEQANVALQGNLAEQEADAAYEEPVAATRPDAVPPSADEIRSIIHTEGTKTFSQSIQLPAEGPALPAVDAIAPPQLGLEAPALDIEPGLLDSDDLSTEEILYQVAKLVENPDVQNAIDRTLGNLDLVGTLPAPLSQAQDVAHIMHSAQGVPVTGDGSGKPHRPVQIVRSDGRVVTLPPIEKPATRSSKKKQDGPPGHYVSEPAPPVPKQKGENDEPAGSDDDSDSDESWNSEDDPDRLWCICKQPHNNRFMICCDTCEDWFHGKCVNVTKAMGQQMEQQGKEWMCPNCVKKLTTDTLPKNTIVTKPAKITMGSPTPRKSIESTSPACIVCGTPSRASSVYCSDQCILKHAQGVERDTKQAPKPIQKVIVFERATGKCLSGPNAPTTANLKQWLRENPGFEVVRPIKQSMTQSKLQLVKTPGKGIALAVNRKGTQVGILPHAPKHQPPTQNTVKLIPATKMAMPGTKTQLTKPLPITPKPKIQPTLKPPTPTTTTPVKPKPTTPTLKLDKPTTPKVIKPKPAPETPTTPITPSKGPDNIRDNVKKTLFEHLTTRLKEVTDLKLPEEEVTKLATDIELQLYKLFGDAGPKYRTKYRSLIFNIKDTKNQTLWRRICEKAIAPAQLVRLSPDELASQELARWRERENKHQIEMIKKSELEMLSINRTYVLKTHKGEQVLEDRPAVKVDSADIIPGLGADSTSEDLSATEKPDSDHSSDRKSAKHGRRDKDRDRKSSKDRARDRSSSKDRRSSKDHGSSRDRRKRSRSRERDKISHRSDRKRSRSRDRHHRSSHKSSRHKRDRHSITDHLDKKSREILDNLENNKIVPPPEDRLWKHVPQQDIQVATPVDSDSDHEPSSTVTIPTPPRSTEQEEQQSQPTPSVSADTQSVPKTEQKTEAQIACSDPCLNQNVSTESTKAESPQPPAPASESPVASPKVKITSKSKKTIIWEGNINMAEVAKFLITLHEVSGDCNGLGSELPATLEIVGRISPDTVWEYIGKMRRSNSKLISILRLTAANMEEQMPYIALYSYLSSRNRLGVIKSTNSAVKDFYILPLASHAPVPQALLPLSGPGFEESRPHLLLGIIVRAKRKRLSTMDIISGSVKRSRTDNSPPPQPAVPAAPPRSYTPPPSRDPRIKLPTVPASVPAPTNDEDEPYSPEDSDPEAPAVSLPAPKTAKPTTDLTYLATPAAATSSLSSADLSSMLSATLKSSSFLETPAVTTFVEPFSNKFDGIPGLDVDNGVDILQRKMEELDKCIEKQMEEIRSISQDIASSGAANMTTNLSNISLPSNLQQILDSIKNIPSTSATDQATSSVEEYYPTPGYKTAPASGQQELTIPLLLPKINSRTQSSTVKSLPTPESASTIPLKLPVTPREVPNDNVALPNLSVPPPRGTQPPAAASAPPPVALPNLNVPPPAAVAAAAATAAAAAVLPKSSSKPSVATIPLNLPKPKPKTQAVVPVAPLTPPGTTPVIIPPADAKSTETKPVSVLSSLSEEELIRKAAEMLGETEPARDDAPKPEDSSDKVAAEKSFPMQAAFKSAPVMYTTPPPPIMTPMPPKRLKLDMSQPPVPGLEEEEY